MAIAETGNNKSTGSSATPSITHGLTINAGDLVFIVGNANASANTWSDNNGVTPLTIDFQETGSGTNTYAIMSRTAGASEPASYAFTVLSSQLWSLIIRVYSGVHADIWDIAPSATTKASGTGLTATAPSMTTNFDGSMGLFVTTNDTATTTLSAPTNGYGDLVEHHTSRTQGIAQRLWASAGITGTASMTLSASQDWMSHQIALKQATVGGATVVQDIIGRGVIAFSR